MANIELSTATEQQKQDIRDSLGVPGLALDSAGNIIGQKGPDGSTQPGLGVAAGSTLQSALPNLMRTVRLYDDGAKSTLRVIGLGSSVGVGATLPDPATQAPSAKLFSALSSKINRLGNLLLTHTNGSVNGTIITDGNLTSYAAAKTAAGGNPTVVCLAYGMNDGTPAQYHTGQTYPGAYLALALLIQTIRGDGADPILMTTPHPHSTRYPWTTVPGAITYPTGGIQNPAATYAASVITADHSGTGVNVPASYRHLRVNQAIRQAGIDFGVPVIDVEKFWFAAVAQYGENALFDSAEFVHPNLLGHQMSYWKAIDTFCNSLDRSAITAGVGSISTEIFVFKPNNATRNTITLTDDSQLSFYAGSNSVWDVECDLHFGTPNASDLRIAFNIPAGTDGRLSLIGPATTATTFTGSEVLSISSVLSGGNIAVGGIGADSYVKVKALVRTGSTPGNVTLQYALATAGGGTATMYRDSSLKAKRVA